MGATDSLEARSGLGQSADELAGHSGLGVKGRWAGKAGGREAC